MTEDHFHALPPGFHLYEYRIQSILGHGGFGITYLAWDTHLEKEVAIKEYLPVEFAVRQGEATVTPRSTGDEEDYYWGLERFLKEAQTLAMFRHPSIVPIFRFFEANGTAYIVMEYVQGDSLSAVVKKQPSRITEGFVLGILVPLLDGLAEVHKTGFLHRDIKPGNIYLRDDGSPVLLDFGAARDAVGRKSASLTAIVTPGYAPLEQYYADGNQGPWTDIYALGAILYQMATGSLPPEAPARVRNDPYVPAVQAGRGRFSKPVLQAIDAALSVDETKRPRDVATWRRMFPATAGTPVTAGSGGGMGTKVALGVVGSLAVLATLGGGLYFSGVLDDLTAGKAPAARNDTARTAIDQPVEIAVLENDEDPEGGDLEVSDIQEPSHGTVQERPGGVILYAPAAGFEGEDRFQYTVAGSEGRTATATVSVIVRGTPNRQPEAVDDEVAGKAEERLRIDVLANDSDPDGDTLSIDVVSEPEHGTAAISEGRTDVLYTPSAGYAGEDRFTYTVEDGNGGTDRANVVVRLAPGNQPPVAVADAAITDQGEAVTIDVLRNDSDPDGDPLEVVAEEGLNGKTEVRSDRRVTYTPSGDFTGKDRFAYTIDDGRGGTDGATVSVTVRAPAQPQPQPEPTPSPSPSPAPSPEPAPSSQVQACPYSADSLNEYYGPGDCFHVQLVFERALGSPIGGAPHRWSNSGTGHSGSVKVDAETTNANGNVCREFVQTVMADGQQHRARGKACFQGTSWQIQS